MFSERLSLEKFEDSLNLPFPIDQTMLTRSYFMEKGVRKIQRTEQKGREFVYKFLNHDVVKFSEAWERKFVKNPKNKNSDPHSPIFLNHRTQVDLFDREFGRLIDRDDPALDIGTLIIMIDFSESPFLEFEQKTSEMIYSKQQILLAPTPCLYTTMENGNT